MSNPSTEPEPDDDPEPDDEPSPARLSSMTKEQLLNYAAEQGIEGVDGGMKKADIIATIEG